ncbi:MAG: HlyC/CorC family transporter [Myxococcales bacterium]|nr:HlyC/CorC family transporter [Myxococcales bacterium]
MIFGLLLTAVFVFLNGFFVAGEFALVKLRATQVDRLAKLDTSAARAAVDVCRRLDRYLSATQLGITLASLGLGSVAEPAVAHAMEGAFIRIGLPAAIWGRVAHALAFTILTAAHILFGELLPKLIAISSAEKVALSVSRPLRVFYWLSLPGLVILNGASTVLLKLLGFPSLHDAEGALSEEEILGMFAQAYVKGALSDEKKKLLERVMRFSDATARQVMVPRLDVVYVDADTSVENAISKARQHGFTRYPVVEAQNLDKVLGYVTIKDLTNEPRPASLRAVIRDAIVTPEGKPLFELMREMQRGRQHFAIVLDEYGGTSGIVTLEDVLEEIVGEIDDEHDEASAKVVPLTEGAFNADGLASINDMADAGIQLPADHEGDTVGGMVLSQLGRMPRPGDAVRIGNYIFTVDAVRRRRVSRVTIRPKPMSERPVASA